MWRMLGVSILFAAAVLLASLLLMLGLMREIGWATAAGFLLLALCTIFGLNPRFLRGSPRAED